jgi:hypothetical protein
MADNYEDEEEYYGEEEGYAEEDGLEDYEDEDEAPAPTKKDGGGSNALVKKALIGLCATVTLLGVAYFAALTLAPDIVQDLANSLPFVSQGEDTAAVGGDVPAPVDGAPPADGGSADPGAEPGSDVAAVPPQPAPAKPKPAPVKPKPAPKASAAAQVFTEGVPPEQMAAVKPQPKPTPKWKKSKWKKPVATASTWQNPSMTAWAEKQAARNAWLARKARWAAAARLKPAGTATVTPDDRSWRARAALR